MNLRLFLILPVLAFLTSCAYQLPDRPKWLLQDTKTGRGIYGLHGNGDSARIEGPIVDGKFVGVSTRYYAGPSGQSSYNADPNQLNSSFYTATFDGFEPVIGKEITLVTPQFNFTGKYVQSPEKAFGTLKYKNGLTITGDFAFEQTPFYNYRVYSESMILGLHADGNATVDWANGDKFQGKIYSHYSFLREMPAGVGQWEFCVENTQIVGLGRLTRIGKSVYVGPMQATLRDDTNNRGNPTSKEDVSRWIATASSCIELLNNAKQRNIGAMQAIDRQQERERAEGQRAAAAMLANDMAALPGKMATQSAAISAASRGTTVQREQEKARLDIEFKARVANASSTSNSQSGNSTGSTSANASRTSNGNGVKDTNGSADTRSPTKEGPFDYKKCVTSQVRETMLLMNDKALAQNWVRIATSFQDTSLGRCESREEVTQRVRSNGLRKIAGISGTLVEEKVLCDLGGGYSYAKLGWGCDMWGRVKRPNGKFVTADFQGE